MDTLAGGYFMAKGDKSFCIDKTIIKNPWLFIKGFYDCIITNHRVGVCKRLSRKMSRGNNYHRQRTCIKNR